MRQLSKYSLLLLFSTLLTSCASQALLLTKSAENDFQRGEELIENGEYTRAVLFLERFSAKYPYSKYTNSAEVLRLEASYKDGQYILSETLGLRFMDTHPNHPEYIYAEYLVAMSYYKQSSSAQLDQEFSLKAHDAFVALNEHFPNSIYVQDISKYLGILTNRVAENETIIGKFYFEKQLYIAASNRFLFVKNKYLNADVAPESLYWLLSSYIALDLQSYALEITVLLQQKFPQSEWRKKAELLM
jgi:outer membrane protein assembly factor BamD